MLTKVVSNQMLLMFSNKLSMYDIYVLLEGSVEIFNIFLYIFLF